MSQFYPGGHQTCNDAVRGAAAIPLVLPVPVAAVVVVAGGTLIAAITVLVVAIGVVGSQRL